LRERKQKKQDQKIRASDVEMAKSDEEQKMADRDAETLKKFVKCSVWQ
jgi:hypothetical protein